MLTYDPARGDERELVHAVVAAATLSLENERLAADLRAKVEEVSASRARIVESGDAARRRLERDLHDGAQQRLVSLALHLRMLGSRIDGDPEAGRQLDAARHDSTRPSKSCASSHADFIPRCSRNAASQRRHRRAGQRAPLRSSSRRSPGERLPAPCGVRPSYFVVAEALTNIAKYARATKASVHVSRANGEVLVEVSDDGVGGADPAGGSGLRGLLDRVSALGGTFEVHSQPGQGTTVRAAIPCE